MRLLEYLKENKEHLFLELLGVFFFLIACDFLLRSYHEAVSSMVLPHFGLRLWLPAVCLGFSYIFARRRRWIFNATALSILTFLVVGDIIYVSYFHTLPRLGYRIPLTQSFEVLDSFIALFSWDRLPVIVMSALIWVWAIYRYRHAHKERSTLNMFLGKFTGLFFIFGALACVVLGLMHPVPDVRFENEEPKMVLPFDHWKSRFSHVAYSQVFGLFSYHANDVYKTLTAKELPTLTPNSPIVQKVESAMMKVRVNDGKGPLFGIAKGMNVVVIQIESMQQFIVDFEFKGKPVTPFLNQLLRDNLSWDYVYDSTYIGRTSDAEFSVMTGMYPDLGAASSFAHVDKNLFAFPRALRDAGYSTASYHGFKLDFWNRTNTHPFYGIDSLNFQEKYDIDEILGLGIPDRLFFPVITEQIMAKEQPSFSYIISLSNHFPYRQVPEDYQTLFTELDHPDLTLYRNYLQLLRYTDDVLREQFKQFKEKGFDKNTLFVIYGDHDLATFNFSLSPRRIAEYNILIHETLGLNPHLGVHDRVPFAIVLPESIREQIPDLGAYQNISGSLVDIMPTLFHLLGEEVPVGVSGQHLFAPTELFKPLPPYSDPLRKSRLMVSYSQDGYVYYRENPEYLDKKTLKPLPFDEKAAAINYQELRQANDATLTFDLQDMLKARKEAASNSSAGRQNRGAQSNK